MYNKRLFGLEKNGSYKVWAINVTNPDYDGKVTMVISHGKEGGAQTEKPEYFTSGKQGRSAYEQAVFEAEARVKKQIDKLYRETKEELKYLPLQAMLASDYNKVGHRIKFPCYTSVKYDGMRCVASKHGGQVFLRSRTGQDVDVPLLAEALNQVMHDNENLDGEIYLHGVELQDILSAVKRSDEKCQAEIDKAFKKMSRDNSVENADAYDHAVRIAHLRDHLEFHAFDIPMDGDFEVRLAALREHEEKRRSHHLIKYCVYNYCVSDFDLKQNHHPVAVKDGFEGVMIRNLCGKYESGKRSGDLQKYKTFFDEEFEILNHGVDKDGHAVFNVLNNVKSDRIIPGIDYINGFAIFSVVLGDHNFRKKVAAMDKFAYSKQFMTVKFQTRYKGTLLPQFPTGVLIRDGKLIKGEFVPSV